jgi:hypothetical protein
MRDLHNNIGVVQAIAPQVVSTGGGPVASGDDVLDLAGFNAAELIMAFGTAGDTLSPTVKIDVRLEHADEDPASPGTAGPFADVEAGDVLGAIPVDGVVLTVDADAKAGRAHRVGYVGYRRFLRVTVAPSDGNTTGTPVAVMLVTGRPHTAPTP